MESTRTLSSGPGAGAEAVSEEGAEAAPALTDRREHPPRDAEQFKEAVLSRVEDVKADFAACLDEWSAVDPWLARWVA